MSRHQLIEGLKFNAPSRTASASWGNFLIVSSDPTPLNPIDEFYETHKGLTALGGLVGTGPLDATLQPLLAGQLLLGYVSATELYIRRLLARTARLCPIIRTKSAQQQIPFSAIDYYDPREIEHALTERVSFTEPGKITAFLRERLNITVARNSSLERAISEFETLCQLRHALVHSRGTVNSSNALSFSLPKSRGQYTVHTKAPELQVAAGVCMDLVREINEETARAVLWSWLTAREIIGKKSKDKKKIQEFLSIFVSTADHPAGLSLATFESVFSACTQTTTALAATAIGSQSR